MVVLVLLVFFRDGGVGAWKGGKKIDLCKLFAGLRRRRSEFGASFIRNDRDC